MSVMRHIRRVVFGITQAEMAKIARVGQASVSRWESGDGEPTRAELKFIRDEAASRSLPWEDAWLFEAPKSAPKRARRRKLAPSAPGAA